MLEICQPIKIGVKTCLKWWWQFYTPGDSFALLDCFQYMKNSYFQPVNLTEFILQIIIFPYMAKHPPSSLLKYCEHIILISRNESIFKRVAIVFYLSNDEPVASISFSLKASPFQDYVFVLPLNRQPPYGV